MKRSLSLIFIYLLPIMPILSQINMSKNVSVILNTNSGLASNEVTSFVQDDQGFMWIGTTGGLCRFDGYDIKTYKSNYLSIDYFTSNDVSCITKDHNQQLWIGTTSGLNNLDLRTGRTKKFTLSELGCKVINALVVGHNNTIYVACDNGVLILDAETGKASVLRDDSGISVENQYIQSLFIDSKNRLWIGFWSVGFCAYDLDKKKFRFFNELGNKELSIMGFLEDKTGDIWVSNWNTDGLYRLKNPSLDKPLDIMVYPVENKHKRRESPVSIYNILQDQTSDKIWMATSEGIKFIENLDDPKSVVHCEIFTKEKMSEDIYQIYQDRTGMIWVSTFGSGLYALDLKRNHFDTYTFPEIKENNEINVISSVYEDSDGILWLGVKSKVLTLLDRKQNKVISYSHHPVLKEIQARANTIVCTTPRNENELWLASRYHGLYIVKMKNNKPISVTHMDETMLRSFRLNTIVKGKNEKMWIGSTKGINCISVDGSEFNIIHDELLNKTMGETNVMTMSYDGQNTMWVGTQNNGIYKIMLSDEGISQSVSNFTLQNKKINNNNILCTFFDSNRQLWVGTQGGGLSRYNSQTNSFEIISEMSRIPSDAIFSINEDDQGNLWLTTGNEIVRYSLKDTTERQMRIFSKNDDLEVSSFQKNVSFRSNSGELIFGGNNGITCFNPQNFKSNKFSPTPQITDILVSNRSVMDMAYDEKLKISQENPSYTPEIEISYKDNSLRIEFAALAFENSNSYKYAYRLEGIDNDWIYTSAKNNYAVYNNLTKGIYRFYVKSYNEDGYPSLQEAMLTINRSPAPWESAWAYALYSILILGIIYLAFWIIINRMNMKRKLEIKRMESIKSEEVNQAKLQFFTNVSHELFTPVTVLSCSLDNLIEEYPKEASLVHTMKMNLNRLMRLLQQIMEFRKAETGNLKLKVSYRDMYSFIKEICEVSFYPMVKTKDVNLFIHHDKKELFGYFDSDKMDKIMFNLLSNAFKYTPQGGQIDIHLNEQTIDETRYAVIRVVDTGSGIDKEKIPLLFTRFYEGDYRRFKTTGTGIGLSLTKDLVSLHRGEITVRSEKKKGSEFTVIIPIDEKEYTFDQIEDLPETPQTLELLEQEVQITESDNAEPKEIKLLLVEDNTDLLLVMHKTLTRFFDITTAQNGQEALEILEQENIDIVVTDVVMPIMDGIELCKQMKSRVELSHIPIIILTAKQNSEDKIEGFDSGADAYVTKPFEVGTLVANIKSLVRNRSFKSQSFKSEDKIKLSEYTYNSVDEEFLQNAIQVVEENLKKDDFTTSDFRDLMNMSQATLYRKLKSITGLSPNEFIRNIKFKMACKLLTEKNLNVSETAYELGFVDPRYFSSVFKKEIGISPSLYIKKHEDANGISLNNSSDQE